MKRGKKAKATHLKVAIEKGVQQRQEGGMEMPAAAHRQWHHSRIPTTKENQRMGKHTHCFEEADTEVRLVSPREASTQMWEAYSWRCDAPGSNLSWITGNPACGG